MATYLAFDLGAGSGRALTGAIHGGKLKLNEIHRFHNGPVKILNHYHWGIVRLFEEMLASLHKCRDLNLSGLAINTWGVDHALINKYDQLVNTPYSYRDSRTEGVMDKVLQIIPKSDLYRLTGIQFMPINTLYQLYAYKLQQPELLYSANKLLMISDLFTFWMTGIKVSEFTNASSTQFLSAYSDEWCTEIFERLELPIEILPPLTEPGTVIGELNSLVKDETGLGNVPVIAPASHDTASAFAAIPNTTDSYCFISSGTWSLIGTQTSLPIINAEGLKNNITNERAPGPVNMLRKNNMGLWLIQESLRKWNDTGNNYSDNIIVKMAEESGFNNSFIEPDHASFFQPGDIPSRIQKFCNQTHQRIPTSPGEISRCIFESLALKYCWVLDVIEGIKGKKSNLLHIVGGGSKNQLLCQMTANATGKTVIAGPDESTAIGNIMMQAIAEGTILSIQEGKQVVRDSFDLRTYEPQDTDLWDEKYACFTNLKETTDTII